MVEVVEREAEGQQDDEVEVADGENPPEVGEPQEEHRAEAEPDPRVVDGSPERSFVTAGHLPGHLRTGPSLRDPTRGVVHPRLDDLACVREGGPDIHRPRALVRVEGGLLRHGFGRIALDPVGHLRDAHDGGDRLLLGQRRGGGLVLGHERGPDQVPLGVVERGHRRGERGGGGDEEGRGDGDG